MQYTEKMKNKRRDFLRNSIIGTAGLTIGGIGFGVSSFASASVGNDSNQTQAKKPELPRKVVPMTEERLGRKSLDHYGSLEETMQILRSYRPLDLNAEEWKKTHPGQSHHEWAREARECLLSGLHYDLPPVDLKAKTLDRLETDSFIREKIEFNTTPWFRVPGYFYTPKNVPLPAPALLVMHEWGGPILF
jgi:hypothetical protein